MNNRTPAIFYSGLQVAVFLLISGLTHAETYRCEQDGKTAFSQTPCAAGARQTEFHGNAHSEPVPEAARQAAVQQLKHEQREASRLEKNRHKADAKHEHEMRIIAAKAEQQKQKCDALHLQIKWAQEDLATTSPKSEAKARLKLKRAKEKADLACGASRMR